MHQTLTFLVTALLSFGFIGLAHAERPYDFSDIDQVQLELPFKVVRTELIGQGLQKVHKLYVNESFSQLGKALENLYAKRKNFGKYQLMGISLSNNKDSYNIVLAYKNEHYSLSLHADGAGSVFSYDAMPSSFISGVYDIAAFGFRMPDGTILPLGLAGEDGF